MFFFHFTRFMLNLQNVAQLLALQRSCRIRCVSLNLLRSYYQSKQKPIRKMNDGYNVVKKIKDLQQNNNNNQNMVIAKAFEIYNNVDTETQQNQYVITAILSCYKKKTSDTNTIKMINHIKNAIVDTDAMRKNDDKYIHAKTSLINIYGKIGDINNAMEVFESISDNQQDIISINSMMNVFNNNKQYNKSILL